jgi:hypothetical protein
MSGSPLQFILYGFVLAGIIFFGRRAFLSVRQNDYSKAAVSVLSAFGIIIVGGILVWINAHFVSPSVGGAPIGEILLFFIMLLGMMASYLTKQIEERRAKIQEKRKVGDGSPTALNFDVWEFLYPMLVSVITFGAILQGIGEKAIDIQALILSFQTGFFWQTVLARSTPK